MQTVLSHRRVQRCARTLLSAAFSGFAMTGMSFALKAGMNFNNEHNEIEHTQPAQPTSQVQAHVWQHDFSYQETPDRGFNIFFARGIMFYLMAFISVCLAIPLLVTTGISIEALIRDPFEGFMLLFSIFLNLLRVLAAAILYKYVRDAWRQVRFDAFDQMLIIENKLPWFELSRTQIFHISDAAGLEIRILKTTDLAPAVADDDPENPACEVLMPLKEGSAIVLLPRVKSIQEARTLVYDISSLTGLVLLTDIHSLYRQIPRVEQQLADEDIL